MGPAPDPLGARHYYHFPSCLKSAIFASEQLQISALAVALNGHKES